MYCLISKPVFIVKSNKIIIHLFYFVKSLNSKKINRKLKYKMRSKLRFILNSQKNYKYKYYYNNTYKLFLKKYYDKI